MSDKQTENIFEQIFQKQKPKKDRIFIHILLFIITFITTTIAGMEWTTGQPGPYEFNDLIKALPYSISILLILGFHEFGHYFASMYHKVKATLPYFIPFPPIPGFLNFGTIGAVIRTKTMVPNNKAMFDIGVSGPIAGFIMCLIILIYGFLNVPGEEYILAIHPDYFSESYGQNSISLEFGSNLLFIMLKSIFIEPGQFFPPMSEIYHYPYLCVGWFGLFVTAMNMIPVGQLDGGHVVYGMFGLKKQENIAGFSMLVLLLLGFMGLFDSMLELQLNIGWTGWLFWAGILYFIIKIKHPPVYHFEKLNSTRIIIGYISLLILILSFIPTPFILTF